MRIKCTRPENVGPDLTPAVMKALKVRNALVRECMAELLGTFVLLVSGRV